MTKNPAPARHLCCLFVLLFLAVSVWAGGSPTDFDNLELFFISTDFGPLPLATCATQACFDEPFTEIADIASMYCDTTPGAIPGAVGYAPEGCVRWWEDQGPFDCGDCGADNQDDEWVRGHKHGQDDLQKPAYVSDCLNGQPCARILPVAEMGPNAQQMACWELENTDVVTVTGDFSLMFLVAPRDQGQDWWYFGTSNNGLLHAVDDDSLYFRAGATPEVQITQPESINVSGEVWHLIEVHRNSAGEYQSFVNGVDVTAPGPPVNFADYEHRYLGAQNCNGSSGGMWGDVAVFLLYSDVLTAVEQEQIRTYLDDLYNYTRGRVFADGFESADTSAW